MSVLPDFRYHRPSSLDEALKLVSIDQLPYAGGTELLLTMRAGLIRPDALVDLKRLSELRRITEAEDGVIVGGSVTHQAVIDSPLVRKSLPILTEVLGTVGNPRVRAAGTLGGNLCFAEPKSDVTTLLDALEAEVELRSATGTRTVPMENLIVGPYTTLREPNELLTSIRIPKRDGRPAVYRKYQTMERPTTCIAAAITLRGACRLVIGAVGGKPAAFEAPSPAELDLDRVLAKLEVLPDLTGSETYKRHLCAHYARDALENLADVS